MFTFFLVKHPEAVQDTIVSDVALPDESANGLTDRGRQHAEAIGHAVAAEEGDIHVYASPRRRCLDAATIIAGAAGTQASSSDALDERKMTTEGADVTLGVYRRTQERGFLAPYDAVPGQESPVAHRLRVERWLADVLAQREPGVTYVVVSHGSVIEHLNSALSWKPAGAMGFTFALCEPGHSHLWRAVELPGGRLVWCMLGANLWLPDRDAETRTRQNEGLAELSAQLSSDPSFVDLARNAAEEAQYTPSMVAYIR